MPCSAVVHRMWTLIKLHLCFGEARETRNEIQAIQRDGHISVGLSLGSPLHLESG